MKKNEEFFQPKNQQEEKSEIKKMKFLSN